MKPRKAGGIHRCRNPTVRGGRVNMRDGNRRAHGQFYQLSNFRSCQQTVTTSGLPASPVGDWWKAAVVPARVTVAVAGGTPFVLDR